MLVKLYFATRRAFAPGDIIKLNRSPHLNNASPEWLAMESAFEAAKPEGCYSRQASRFACASIEDCLTFYGPQAQAGQAKRVYSVFMWNPTIVPMALAGRGLHHHASPDVLAAIAREYWAKELHDWEFLEYIAPEMGIIDEVTGQEGDMELASSSISYGNDRASAIAIWG